MQSKTLAAGAKYLYNRINITAQEAAAMSNTTPVLAHIKTLEFDLYLDESGDFSSSNREWLVGGFLLPRSGNAAATVQGWWQRVLEAVDERWPGKRREHYVLAHCSDRLNDLFGGEMPRSQVQPMVLEMLTKFIREAKGFPVIFLCPKGECLQNGEYNFACTLAKGYLLLQVQLQSLYPGMIVRIIPHISHRTETRGTDLQHDGTEKGILQAYIAHIRRDAFGVCNVKQLKDTLDRAELLTTTKPPLISALGDLQEDIPSTVGVYVNLFNVICDYICNSYYDRAKNSYESLLKDAAVISIYRDGASAPKVAMTQPAEELPPPKEEAIESCRKLLLSRSGIFKFNDFDPELQRALIQQLCDEIRPFVMRQEQMENTDRDLSLLLKIAEGVHDEAIRAELTANLLLFRIALANHRGDIKQMESFSDSFRTALRGIEDAEASNALAAMFYNRRIVTNTDMFDYAAAEEDFLMMRRYWESHSSVCAEYGKLINSSLQNIRHKMRLSGSRAERNALYMEALSRARIARLQFSTPYDLSRLEQTMSNIESEAGEFDRAFHSLFTAAQLIGGAEWTQAHPLGKDPREAITFERCEAFMTIVGKRIDKKQVKMDEPFMLFHYLRLADEMCIAGDSRYALLFEALLKHPGALEPSSYDVIRAIHPRTQILWKLGSIAARSGVNRDAAKKLMNAAFKQLRDSQSILFGAIAIAVGAEHIALQLPGSTEKLAAVRSLYADFTVQKSLFMRDPFAACGVSGPLTGGDFTPEDMMHISRLIAY